MSMSTDALIQYLKKQYQARTSICNHIAQWCFNQNTNPSQTQFTMHANVWHTKLIFYMTLFSQSILYTSISIDALNHYTCNNVKHVQPSQLIQLNDASIRMEIEVKPNSWCMHAHVQNLIILHGTFLRVRNLSRTPRLCLLTRSYNST